MHDWLYTAFYIACGMLNVAKFYVPCRALHAACRQAPNRTRTADGSTAIRVPRLPVPRVPEANQPSRGADVAGPSPSPGADVARGGGPFPRLPAAPHGKHEDCSNEQIVEREDFRMVRVHPHQRRERERAGCRIVSALRCGRSHRPGLAEPGEETWACTRSGTPDGWAVKIWAG